MLKQDLNCNFLLYSKKLERLLVAKSGNKYRFWPDGASLWCMLTTLTKFGENQTTPFSAIRITDNWTGIYGYEFFIAINALRFSKAYAKLES